jgi:hypothetical protein
VFGEVAILKADPAHLLPLLYSAPIIGRLYLCIGHTIAQRNLENDLVGSSHLTHDSACARDCVYTRRPNAHIDGRWHRAIASLLRGERALLASIKIVVFLAGHVMHDNVSETDRFHLGFKRSIHLDVWDSRNSVSKYGFREQQKSKTLALSRTPICGLVI